MAGMMQQLEAIPLRGTVLSLFLLLALHSLFVIAADKQVRTKGDPNDNQGNTPFLLEDPYDNSCFGVNGFTLCDENALWILTKRNGKKTYSLVPLYTAPSKTNCLEHKKGFFGIGRDEVGLGPCKSAGSQGWEFEFVDQKHVRLSTKGMCLVRGKKQYKNKASLQSCKQGEFIPLIYHPTAVHESGFYIKAADGTCFDGTKFRSCESISASRLLWGVGVKFIWGEATRYIFNFKDRTACILARGGGKVERGSCKDSAALSWNLHHGQLSTKNGKMCLSRKLDNTGVMSKCSENFEHISMEVPTVYTNEQLASMIKNENLSPTEKAALAEALQRKNQVR